MSLTATMCAAIVMAWRAVAVSVLLLFQLVGESSATQIVYANGQPLAGGILSIYVVDVTPGPPQAAPSPTIQQDGDVINIYYQLPYSPGAPTSTTLYTQYGPLAEGEYQVNYYAAMWVPGSPFPDYSLRLSSQLTVLAFTDMHRAYEYYYAAKDHYFVTSDPVEIQALDSGVFLGWTRTGQWFWTFGPLQSIPSTLLPVCRFYGLPSAGLDSHFFSDSSFECQYVHDHWSYAWQLEAMNAFEVVPTDPVGGFCPPDTLLVHRLYNNRGDANHRYTVSLSIRSAMVAQGWVDEGGVWCTSVLQ